VTQIEDTIH